MRIVLVHPRIPGNTASIGRLCAATETPLTLVKPLFSLDEGRVRRAGLDYWPWIDLTVVDDWRDALAGPGRPWLFTAGTRRLYTDVTYGDDDVLVFGREDLGLEPEILAAYPDNHVSIPMVSPHVRSLNLAQCAAVGLYEAWRQRERTPPMRSDDDADEGTADAAAWLARVEPELALAQAAWQGGNAGKGRVASRRAAGMALKAWLAQQPRAHYGKNFMHHLNALADDEGVPQAEREAAWRLAARPRPEGGFAVPIPERLTPMEDAALIIAYCRAALGA
ncbi:MAG: tRNA (cytidine(34)-2'-O)-methyltransferase [bacterium]